MRKYEFLPEAKEISLKIEGDTPEEFFKAALAGMSEVIKKDFCGVRIETESKMLRIASLDFAALLVDFLSEVHQYAIEEGVVYCRVKLLKIESNLLEAEIYGRGAKGLDGKIKSIRIQDPEIQKNAAGNWETTIILEVQKNQDPTSVNK